MAWLTVPDSAAAAPAEPFEGPIQRRVLTDHQDSGIPAVADPGSAPEVGAEAAAAEPSFDEPAAPTSSRPGDWAAPVADLPGVAEPFEAPEWRAPFVEQSA